MADYTLTSGQRAPILDDEDIQLSFDDFTVVSSNPSVASVGEGIQTGHWQIAGGAPGTTTVVVTRTADGATVSHTVEVPATLPFDWHLGAEQPA